ncbi:hypothetical protein LSTR_LSTR006145 [Laodelphax striatellus]|uniref:Protein yellow n=1 Tax=Laodelphax striatellus TaxID=195883 RepID=A0A482WZS5_LAOST|nr:hypothetical protein LSTR_LSTR006145 [Laodelphax striatellus]
MRRFVIPILACLSVASGQAVSDPAPPPPGLTERFFWNQLDYAYPTPQMRAAALNSQEFVPKNNLPVGIEVWNNKLFISVPRWDKGVPSTLNFVPLEDEYGHPLPPISNAPLIPYPDWETNQMGAPCKNRLNTVYRMRADECGRLWVLDSGTIGIGDTTQQVCPYGLHVYDLNTNQQIHYYQLQASDTNKDSFIANIVVDVGGNCSDTHVYASDELGYGLIVYSLDKDFSWRFDHQYFHPDPVAGDYNIGLNYQWSEEGIFAMELTPVQPDGSKTLLFHPLSSYRNFFVSTNILKDQSKAISKNYFHDFSYFPDLGPNFHITTQVIHNGVLYKNLIDQNALGCWRLDKDYTPANHAIITKEDTSFIYPSDLRITKTGTLWAITDRMPIHLMATLDFKDINFRIFSGDANQLVAGTICDPYLQAPPKPQPSAYNYHRYDPEYKTNYYPESVSPYRTPLKPVKEYD